MTKDKILLLTISLGLVIAFSLSALGEEVQLSRIDWDTGLVYVTGFGAAPDGLNPGVAQLLSQRVAKADAYRNALEVLEGVRVNSETLVQDYMLARDDIYTQVDGFIQGGVFTEIQFEAGICQVTLVLPIGGQGGLTSLLQDEFEANRPLTPIQYHVEVPSKKKFSTQYTGLIIDTRGQHVQPCIYPQIFDPKGRLLYGSTLIDVDRTGFTTMVAYSRSLQEAQAMERVGENPLILQAVTSVPSSQGIITDIVLDSEAVKVFNDLFNKSDIIAEGAIVFLID